MKSSFADLHKINSIKCQSYTHIETSQLICTASRLTGFYMRATLAFNGLSLIRFFFFFLTFFYKCNYFLKSKTRMFLKIINLTTFWNQTHEFFWKYVSCQWSSGTELFLQFAFLKFLEIFWKHCCVVSRILQKNHWKESFLVTLSICCCELMHRYYSVCS